MPWPRCVPVHFLPPAPPQPLIRLARQLSSIPGLTSYSSPKFWPNDSSTLIGSIHVRLAPSASVDQVLERVDEEMRTRVKGLEELTIQVERAEHAPRP